MEGGMSRRAQKLELTWYNKDQALIPTEGGRYGYTWVDPQDPRYCETHTLVFDETVYCAQKPKTEGTTYSKRADITPTKDNLLVLGESGDFLEALTRVPELADKYVGKIKCVYIDPPFNTAQTFANYEDNLEHSVWLTMMRDRLIHLRNLLSDDGSIWVHLDDCENHRMRVLLDEVFGSSNFVAEVQWQKADSGRNDVTGFSIDQDVILVYGKTNELSLNRMPRTEKDNARFSNPDGDEHGVWFSDNRSAPGAQERGYVGAIEHPLTGELFYPANGSHWRYNAERLLQSLKQYGDYIFSEPDAENIKERARRMDIDPKDVRVDMPDIVLASRNPKKAQDRIEQGNWPEFFVTKNSFGRKSYPPKHGQPPRTWWTNNEVGHNREAKSEIKALFPSSTPFSTPKPERLLERILHIATNPGDIVLDIFAGSGTTAAVAQKMGRRWVTCELMENTIESFTRPRLEKVIKGEDMGGISITEGERMDNTDEGLPEGLTPDDAQKLTSLLNKALSNQPEIKKDPTVKTIKRLIATKKAKDVINWRGGGGFTMARLSPSCFGYDPEIDLVTLTKNATGQILVDSVAANLGFYLTPEDRHFDGVLGRQHLAVIEGVLNEDKVNDLMAHLPQGNTLLIAATIVDEGIREYIRSFKKGSRIINIPLDIFTYTQKQEEK